MYITQDIKHQIALLRNTGLACLLAGAVAIGAHAQQTQQDQQTQQNHSGDQNQQDQHTGDQNQQDQHSGDQNQQKAQGQQSQQKQELPEGPGKEAVQRVCSACHGAEIVIGRGLTRDGWTQVVTDMIQRGAQGSEDDFAQIVEYLATNFPPKSSTNSSK